MDSMLSSDLFWGSVVIGIGLLFVIFPEKMAEIRSRNARDPTPNDKAILNMMIAGLLFIFIGIVGIWAS